MSREDIGERGQWLFSLLITELHGREQPFFRPRFLGEKYPTFDYLVELADHPNYFFFAQVKATTQGYTQDPVRLRVQVSQKDVDRMVANPAPGYLIGIDANSFGLGFLLSIKEARDRVASLTTRFQLDSRVLGQLYDEVHAYWSSRDMILKASSFQE